MDSIVPDITLTWHRDTNAVNIDSPLSPAELHHLLLQAAFASLPEWADGTHRQAMALVLATWNDSARLGLLAEIAREAESLPPSEASSACDEPVARERT